MVHLGLRRPEPLVLAALATNVAPAWWIGFGINAVWMLAVAYVLSRIPLATWYGDRSPRPTDTEAAPGGRRLAEQSTT